MEGHTTIDLELNPSSIIPLYLQVKRNLKKEILNGRFPHEGRLPSMKRLGQENSISVVTVEKAYRELEKEGYIARLRGLGYYVKKQKVALFQDNSA